MATLTRHQSALEWRSGASQSLPPSLSFLPCTTWGGEAEECEVMTRELFLAVPTPLRLCFQLHARHLEVPHLQAQTPPSSLPTARLFLWDEGECNSSVSIGPTFRTMLLCQILLCPHCPRAASRVRANQQAAATSAATHVPENQAPVLAGAGAAFQSLQVPTQTPSF